MSRQIKQEPQEEVRTAKSPFEYLASLPGSLENQLIRKRSQLKEHIRDVKRCKLGIKIIETKKYIRDNRRVVDTLEHEIEEHRSKIEAKKAEAEALLARNSKYYRELGQLSQVQIDSDSGSDSDLE